MLNSWPKRQIFGIVAVPGSKTQMLIIHPSQDSVGLCRHVRGVDPPDPGRALAPSQD